MWYDDKVAQRIRAVLSRYIDGELPDELNWVSLVTPDDLDFLLAEIEQKFYGTPYLFKSKLTEEDMQAFATVGDLVQYISAKLKE
jgi:hypothetical protein